MFLTKYLAGHYVTWFSTPLTTFTYLSVQKKWNPCVTNDTFSQEKCKKFPCLWSPTALLEKCLCSELSGTYFPTFGLNTERYSVSLCIQSKCGKYVPGKIRIRTLFTQWWLSDTYLGSYHLSLTKFFWKKRLLLNSSLWPLRKF